MEVVLAGLLLAGVLAVGKKLREPTAGVLRWMGVRVRRWWFRWMVRWLVYRMLVRCEKRARPLLVGCESVSSPRRWLAAVLDARRDVVAVYTVDGRAIRKYVERNETLWNPRSMGFGAILAAYNAMEGHRADLGPYNSLREWEGAKDPISYAGVLRWVDAALALPVVSSPMLKVAAWRWKRRGRKADQ